MKTITIRQFFDVDEAWKWALDEVRAIGGDEEDFPFDIDIEVKGMGNGSFRASVTVDPDQKEFDFGTEYQGCKHG